jgi:hypothetical protein
MSSSVSCRSIVRTIGVVAVLGLATQGAVAAGNGAVTLLNCSDRAVTVKAFNSDDEQMAVPTQTNAIANGQELTLKCETSACTLTVEGLKTEPKSGYFVYKNKALMPSDKDAMAKGCRQFD